MTPNKPPVFLVEMIPTFDEVPEFISRFLATPGGALPCDLDRILKPSLAAEAHLRLAFAAERDVSDPRLEDPHIGLLSLYDAPASLRIIRARSDPPNQYNPGRMGFQFRPPCHTVDDGYLFPLDPKYRRQSGDPAVAPDLTEFLCNWEAFTTNSLRYMNWDNVVVAGGSVTACLLPYNPAFLNNRGESFSTHYPKADVDLFLWGLNEEQAKEKMVQIYEAIRKAAPWKTIVIRKKNTISIYSRHPFRVVQIVLRLYRSPSEILTGFDVDCACVAFDGTHIWANPRATMAFIRQANKIDVSRRSPSYEFRLAKYADRGFEVRYPSLDRTKIEPSVLDFRKKSYPCGLARLLVLENIAICSPYHPLAPEPVPVIVPSRTCAQKAYFKAMETCDYDAAVTFIPYGPSWTAARVIYLRDRMELRLNGIHMPGPESTIQSKTQKKEENVGHEDHEADGPLRDSANIGSGREIVGDGSVEEDGQSRSRNTERGIAIGATRRLKANGKKRDLVSGTTLSIATPFSVRRISKIALKTCVRSGNAHTPPTVRQKQQREVSEECLVDELKKALAEVKHLEEVVDLLLGRLIGSREKTHLCFVDPFDRTEYHERHKGSEKTVLLRPSPEANGTGVRSARLHRQQSGEDPTSSSSFQDSTEHDDFALPSFPDATERDRNIIRSYGGVVGHG
ncbi:hypothetical protein NLJ89_g5876 [Agrocybe chaxingu]|uniref:Uncharacterized protein n=1 Tax=Agrocybe chaxingu TaxID=84603 RepID=A0A9W8K6M4_9AGAR|nr:hypothetical protein NLJ89_g5876 [Agrocybe chaxingu]